VSTTSWTRTIYYSLVEQERAPHARQWIQSIASLRRFNRDIPVRLFVFGQVGDEIRDAADRYRASVTQCGRYEGHIRGLSPAKARAVSLNPRLHKHLVLSYFNEQNLSQLMYLDCDTYFLDDVTRLFDHYSTAQWYAREDRYVDERIFARLATSEEACPVPTYNSGVIVLNRPGWQTLSLQDRTLVGYVWRLLVGLYMGTERDVALDLLQQRAIAEALTPEDASQRIDIPAKYSWIVGQIACWLTLGKVPELARDSIGTKHVLQGPEFYHAGMPGYDPVLIHYFSCWQRSFFDWLQARECPPAHSYIFRGASRRRRTVFNVGDTVRGLT
jgi:hypothetical protein